MSQRVFWGIDQSSWVALASVVAAAVSVVNLGLGVILTVFNRKYLLANRELVEAGKAQAAAAMRQADSSVSTAEVLQTQSQEASSFRRAAFTAAMVEVDLNLSRYIEIVNNLALSWKDEHCRLLPQNWELCREFVSHESPEFLAEMVGLEKSLQEEALEVEGVLRQPVSYWLSTKNKRTEIAARLATSRKRTQKFADTVLKSSVR